MDLPGPAYQPVAAGATVAGRVVLGFPALSGKMTNYSKYFLTVSILIEFSISQSFNRNGVVVIVVVVVVVGIVVVVVVVIIIVIVVVIMVVVVVVVGIVVVIVAVGVIVVVGSIL